MRKLPHLLVLATLATVLVAFRPIPSRTSDPVPPANDAIEEAMDQLQQSMKALGKGINAENSASALDELAKMENALLSAKAQVPDTAAAVDEKKRGAFVAEFRTTLLEAVKLACDAEIAVVNGKYKDAEGILRNKLGGLKSEGHDKFKGDKDKKGR